MPIYKYHCKNCNTDTTINCSMKDYTPLIPCSCGSEAERKVEDLVANYADCQGFYGKKSK